MIAQMRNREPGIPETGVAQRHSSSSQPRLHITVSLPVAEEGNSREPSVKKIEFRLAAPAAKAVKLTGDFTGWQKAPIAMTRTSSGVWEARLTLSPGKYRYRYLVD